MAGQIHLFKDFSQEPHANRGRALESMLEVAHVSYEKQQIGSVEKLPNAFVFCSEGEWRGIKEPALKARTADGKPLKRAKTDCDYKGHVRGYGVAFDAKEFAGASIPFTNFKRHQILRLYEFMRTGGIAGFMVWAKRTDEVFWIPADLLIKVWTHFDRKSLPIEWLQTNARLICTLRPGAIIDWAAKIIPELPKAA